MALGMAEHAPEGVALIEAFVNTRCLAYGREEFNPLQTQAWLIRRGLSAVRNVTHD